MAGVKRFEDLRIWQWGVDLRDEIVRCTESGRALKDLRFREQVRDSARSVPRNLAEGFDKFQPREFERFMRIARGSLGETKNHILDGLKHGYFTQDDADRMLSLVHRCYSGTTHLMRYLHSCNGKPPTGWDVG